MADKQNHKIDKLTGVLGFVIGYLLFSCFLVFYQLKTIGHFNSDDFTWRLITPFILIKGHWTDIACYVLVVVSVLGIAKLRDQI